MTDQRDTPDTRTPSAETLAKVEADVATLLSDYVRGLGHGPAPQTDAAAARVIVRRVMADLAAPLPGRGSDAPSAPNRAPTDEARCTCGHRWKMHTYDGCHHLIDLTPPTRCPCPEDRPALAEETADRAALARRLDSYATVLGVQLGKGGEGALVEEARAALEDLTRENERLRAEAEQLKADRNRLVDEWARDGRVLDRALAAELQVAAVRALCDSYERSGYPDALIPKGQTIAEFRAALDTASDRARTATHDETGREDLMGGGSGEPRGIRPEDGYGTDNVPGGWGGPGSQETRDA